MKLAKNKKGIFFTMIAILIVTVLFVTFAPQSSVTLKHKIPSTTSRVNTANDFVETIKTSYIQTALHVASYNALNSLSTYLRERGTTLFVDYDALNKQFTEVMLNGTIECDPIGSPGVHESVETCVCGLDPSCLDPLDITLMRNRNFTQRLRDIEFASLQTLQLETVFSSTYSDFAVELIQDESTGPFRVGVNVTINFSVNAELAWWNSTESIYFMFDIAGIEDPLYSVKSTSVLGTRYTNVFNETNLTLWNLTKVFLLADARTYNFNEEGSSFLGRYTEVDVGSECCGLESLINPVVMDNPSVLALEKPYVDWCFFGSRCPSDIAGALWNITCISPQAAGSKFSGFSLDSSHLSKYNLSDVDAEGRDLFYTTTDPNSPATCSNMMQSVCNTPGSPYPCI